MKPSSTTDIGTATDADRGPAPSDAGKLHRSVASARRLGRIVASARRFGRIPRFSIARFSIARFSIARFSIARFSIPRFGRLPRFSRVRRVESPVAASLLSYLLPGLGQLVMGRRREALLFMVPSLLGLGWIALQLGEGLDWFGLSLFDETFVATLIAVVAFLAIWRILAVRDAFLTAPGRPRRRRLARAFTAALLLSIVATHVAVIAGAWAVYQTGVAINNNDMLSDSALAGASQSEEPVLHGNEWDFGRYMPSPPGPTPAPTRWVDNPDRINFLLIGVDFMTGRSHALTDSLIMATLDVRTNKATIVSIPRETAYFELYYGGWVSPTFELDYLMNAASSPSFHSPDSGIETLKKEIGFLVGLPVDYYAAVDLEGFVAIVEAMGGVDVDVKFAVNDPFTGTFVPKGLVHMDGHLALKYARSRMSSSEYARESRQQQLLVALARKLVTSRVLANLPQILALAGRTIASDFPMKYWRNFITAFRRVGTPTQCVLGPPYSYHPDSSTTSGKWTSRLNMDLVAGLSVSLFGRESLYYTKPGVVPAPCKS